MTIERMGNDQAWATKYRFGWTVYARCTGVFADRLSQEAAQKILADFGIEWHPLPQETA